MIDTFGLALGHLLSGRPRPRTLDEPDLVAGAGAIERVLGLLGGPGRAQARGQGRSRTRRPDF